MSQDNRTFSIGERAVELMTAYCTSASPRSYELWFTYVTGIKPRLNEAVKGHIATAEKLSERHVDELYDAHLSTSRPAEKAEQAGASMLSEIGKVMTMIDSALGSTARYDASLQALSADLAAPTDDRSLRGILESLVLATREVASTNQALETRLRDSSGEIENLRQVLETSRLENLIDPLTGIANRKHFDVTLASSVHGAGQSGAPLALLVIDIDEFKRFNDVYGHATGDQVLRLVASAMRETVDMNATLARFGGEEFGIIIPGAQDASAWDCAEAIRRSVEGRELLKRSSGESLGRVTVSIGVAMLRPEENAVSLLDRADHCMYRAKRTGRNRTVRDSDVEPAELTNAA